MNRTDDPPTMPASVRRVVVSEARDGRSTMAFAFPSPRLFELATGLKVWDIWRTSQLPTSLKAGDGTDDTLSLDPAPGGVNFRICDFPPGRRDINEASANRLYEQLDARHALRDLNDGRGAMHQTDTLDFALVLSGAITVVVDDGETILQAGDVLIQQGTRHIWYNHGSSASRVAFIMLSAGRAISR